MKRHANGKVGYIRIKFGDDDRLNTKRAITSDGEVTTVLNAQKEFAKKHRDKWGALSLEAARVLHETTEHEDRHFSFWYDPEKLNTKNFQDDLDKRSSHYTIREKPPYIVSSTLTVNDAKKLAKDYKNSIFSIHYESTPSLQSSEGTISTNGYPLNEGVAAYMRTDNKYNSNGIYGGKTFGVKVGIADSLGDSRRHSNGYPRMSDDHEAFQHANIEYTHTPLSTQPCQSDQDCALNQGFIDIAGGATGGGVACREFSNSWGSAPVGEKRCVTLINDNGPKSHIANVMSRVAASTQGNRRHAAEANMVVWNGPREPVNAAATNIARIYNTFRSKNALIIPRAMGDACPVHTGSKEAALSWYSVNENMFTIEASSNATKGRNGNYSADACDGPNIELDPPKGNNFRTDCGSLDSLCVGATKSKGPIRDYRTDSIPKWSRWKNPYNIDTRNGFSGISPSDAERPDVVTEGKAAWVATPWAGSTQESTTSRWETKSGTSFSAPAVAGLSALFVEQCGFYPGPLGFRSMIRTGSYQTHYLEGKEHEQYTTPGGLFDDAKTAAGVANSWVSIFCEGGGGGGGGGEPGAGESETKDGDPVPPWLTTEEPDPDTPTKQNQSTTELKISQSTNPHWKHLWNVEELEKGDRLRFTLSFPTCPIDNWDSTSNIGEIRSAVDVDLVACGTNTDTGAKDCEMVSQSFDDTNEGFDFIANNDWDDFKISMVYPTTESDGSPRNTCDRFFGEYVDHTVVPTFWAGIIWR